MSYKASAPGSLMLLGEYGVLYGKHALVCAIDKRLTVTLTPREDEQIILTRDDGAAPITYTTSLKELTVEKPFQYALGALKHVQNRLKHGCDIQINTQMSDQVGFGSSAAVTVAMLAALYSWLAIRTTPIDLVRHGRNVVRAIQGVGSGADVAASVYGGMVGYQAQPLSAEKFMNTYALTAVYSGYKKPTPEVIAHVQQQFAAHPALLRSIINGVGQCALDGMAYLRKGEWARLGEVMNIQQGFMEALGVSTPELRDMVEWLRQVPGMLGAKISGSGLGDCVIGLGDSGQHGKLVESGQFIPVEMTLQGVHCEKI